MANNSIFPEPAAGGLEIRDPSTGAPTNPAAVEQAYVPAPEFVSTCPITALPSDCTARIEPRQINAIVSELTSFAECLDPDGPWDCGSLANLCAAFNVWKATSVVPANLISADADNLIVIGSDGKLYASGEDPLSVAHGGTGAVTAPAALTSLGAVAKAGDTMTGALSIPVTPTIPAHAASKQYVDTVLSAATGGTITEAPNDGVLYGRKSLGWYPASGVVVQDTPPPTPDPGDLWYESDSGILWIYLDDGTSSQWVQAAGSSSVIMPAPQCGFLGFINATTIKFSPHRGDSIKINGHIYQIPAAGVLGSNASLAASTVYRVYCYNNAGTLTLEFSATAHSTSATPGNIGVEIKAGDDTRSFVGLVRTDASSQFFNQTDLIGVRSWFNKAAAVSRISTAGSTTSIVFAQIGGSAGMLTFANEKLTLTLSGIISSNVATTNPVSLELNGLSMTSVGFYSAVNGAACGCTLVYSGIMTEAFHVGSMRAAVGEAGYTATTSTFVLMEAA